MKTYTPKEAAHAMLDGNRLTDGQDKYEWSDLAGCYVVVKKEIGDTSRTEATAMLLRVPDNLYDYEPAKPKVTLDEIERRLIARENFTIKIKTPFGVPGEPCKVVASCAPWGDGINFDIVHRVKLVLDRIEAGAEGWEVSFCDE